MMKKRPHIIIFNPDEMRADTMAHLGNPAAITPNLDEFARTDGVSFRHAFCQNPVCVPSRCSFFQGLYPHVNGHRTMAHLLRPGEPSMFREMKDAGYYVWMNGRNDLYAAQYQGWIESNADEVFYGGDCPKAPGPEKENPRGVQGDASFYSHFEGKLRLDEHGKNYTADDEAVDALINRVLNPIDDRPICAFVGLLYPHTPYGIEEPYFSAIDRSKVPSRVRPEECIGKPAMEEELRKMQQMQNYTEEEWTELRAVYLAMCTKVDDQFGRLCNELKKAGIYDDCAIFVLSDHGDFTGDYGIPEKAQNCFEECLVSVPFLIKPPAWESVDAGVSDSLVELVDFYATVMDYAQTAPTHTHFGKSLRPIIEDRSKKLRQYVFCEGGRMPGETHCDEWHINGPNGSPKDFVYWPRQTAQLNDKAHGKATMIRDDRYKFITRSQDMDEFYDLEKDPGERFNQINNPQYKGQIYTMQQAMLKWYQETCDIVPWDFDARFNKELLWAKIKSSVPPEKAEEVKSILEKDPSLRAVRQYLRG